MIFALLQERKFQGTGTVPAAGSDCVCSTRSTHHLRSFRREWTEGSGGWHRLTLVLSTTFASPL